jgi:transcriptional regulator with XRE-family HTH domain
MSEEQKKLINQHEVARRLGVVPSYVCMILNGQRKGPKAQKLLQQVIEIYVQQFKQAA